MRTRNGLLLSNKPGYESGAVFSIYFSPTFPKKKYISGIGICRSCCRAGETKWKETLNPTLATLKQPARRLWELTFKFWQAAVQFKTENGICLKKYK